MLTDTRLRHLKPKEKLYKVNDRDGLYVAVTPAGTISFRYNYSINGRQETVTFGRYGVGGITLAEARERLNEAKKMVASGRSPAREKARDKARIKDAETFGAWAEKWLRGYQMAESTRDMRRSVYQRELKSMPCHEAQISLCLQAVPDQLDSPPSDRAQWPSDRLAIQSLWRVQLSPVPLSRQCYRLMHVSLHV